MTTVGRLRHPARPEALGGSRASTDRPPSPDIRTNDQARCSVVLEVACQT
jgi:hypothetical protein